MTKMRFFLILPNKTFSWWLLTLTSKVDQNLWGKKCRLHTGCTRTLKKPLTNNVRGSSFAVQDSFSRGGRARARTLDLWFWRPSLYQLSYTPKQYKSITGKTRLCQERLTQIQGNLGL
jgi:hypothetical protein